MSKKCRKQNFTQFLHISEYISTAECPRPPGNILTGCLTAGWYSQFLLFLVGGGGVGKRHCEGSVSGQNHNTVISATD